MKQTQFALIPIRPGADERISVYGSYNMIYVAAGRAHATTYSYQYPIAEVDGAILDFYFDELAAQQPKLIVVENGNYDARMREFVANYSYTLCGRKTRRHRRVPCRFL